MKHSERTIRQGMARRVLNASSWAFEAHTIGQRPGHRIRVQIGALIMHDRILDATFRRPL